MITVIVSITYFSYAFFTRKDEYHGRLNIVAGTLNYKIESSDLINNSITLNAKESKTIEIEIKSLNNIQSKYELYYVTNSNVEVGYSVDSVDNPTGTINSNDSKIVKVILSNKENTEVTVNFGVAGGFTDKLLTLETEKNSITEYSGTATITLNANGGSVSPASVSANYGTAIGTLPKPTRSGYTFKGWYTASSGGEAVTSETLAYFDTTIYAQWIQGYYLRVGGNFAYAPYNEKVCSKFTVGSTFLYDSYLKTGTNITYVSPGARISVYSYYGTGTVWYNASNTQICSNKANAYFTMPSYPLVVGISDSWGGRDRTIRLNRADDDGNVGQAVTLSVGCN